MQSQSQNWQACFGYFLTSFDQKFSGASLMEVVQQAMPHMMSDEAHKANIMDMKKRTGENQDQWMARIQKEFDAREVDK